MMVKNTLRYVVGALLAATLLGCTSTRVPEEPTYEVAAAHPFVAANRAAVKQLLNGVAPGLVSPLLVATMVDVNDLRVSSPLGRTLSEQISSGAVAAGIDVREIKLRGDVYVREQTGELLLSRELKDIVRVHQAAGVLVGTYAVSRQYVFVNIKLVRADSGQILRSHDYALPLDRDVQRLLRTPAER